MIPFRFTPIRQAQSWIPNAALRTVCNLCIWGQPLQFSMPEPAGLLVRATTLSLWYPAYTMRVPFRFSGAGLGGVGFGQGRGEEPHERFDGGKGKHDLDRLQFFAPATVHGEHEHRGFGSGGLEIFAVVFVAEERRAQVAHFRPVIAPFGEDERGDLVNERDFNFAEVAV